MVYFIGAGPGDVDLITVKGRNILSSADVVIYAGSLVSAEHMSFCKEDVSSSQFCFHDVRRCYRGYEKGT